jgi:hypothetical protein
MESTHAYLTRKGRETELFNRCLATPLPLEAPTNEATASDRRGIHAVARESGIVPSAGGAVARGK